MPKEKIKFWTPYPILEYNAKYNMIFGERSNGKTYGTFEYCLRQYFENGSEFAIIRRWEEDFKGKRAQSMFNAHIENGLIIKLSQGKYNTVVYRSSRWYFAFYDSESGKNTDVSENPFAYAFAITQGVHDKSTAYPRIDNIVFDEFLDRNGYLPNEFVLFCNILSTIIRLRDNVKIFMLGNTVNKSCPYFNEMGITNVKKMKQGSIDLYTYGDSGLTVAVEYCGNITKKKKSDVYFAFDNPALNMITKGSWELEIYPHNPYHYLPKDIKFTYFIEFERDLLQCEIIMSDNLTYTFIHPKTTPIKDEMKDLIFTLEYHPQMNYRRNIYKPQTEIDKKLLWYFVNDRVYYADNETGEIVRNYLMSCKA